jgi:hypothetical protein
MSTIIINSESDFTSSPYTIPANSTVIINSSFGISDLAKYFIIGGSNVVIDGKFNSITIMIQNYPGLVQNGTGLTLSNYTNIVIKNLSILGNGGSLLANSGWFCQNNFSNGSLQFCKSNGTIPENSGGIFGSQCYNCTCTNCYSTGSINKYGGGIFGSYALNCNVSNSYSSGPIGTYSGGIFGFGTNYIWDGSNMSPTVINDQDGNPINIPSNPNNYVITATICTVFSSYSIGNIGSYGGGIYGYFAYKSNCKNSYSLGSGNLLSGGIFAPNYYNSSGILSPSSTLCDSSNCYVIGLFLSGNGIFAYVGLKNLSATNITSYCYSEDYDSCGRDKNWNNKNACKFLLYKNNTIWTMVDLCYSNIPWLLTSFTRTLYFPNYLITNYYTQSYSCLPCGISQEFNTEKYSIINVNNHIVNPCKIKINENNGQLFFMDSKCGKYKILVIRGNKIEYILDQTSYYTYIDYYFTNFYLESKK